MTTIDPKDISTGKLHAYLLSAIAPRPIAFASTIDAEGNPNLSPFSFFNVFSANPPILVFSPARRVRNNTTKHTLDNVLNTKEVVINVVNHAIVQQMSLSSSEYPEDVNEFEKAGLTMLASKSVRPFRVAESPVQFECKVNDVIHLGQEGGAGNLVICQVVKLHIKTAVLAEDGSIDQNKLDLVARAGGSYYARARSGFFQVPKPLSTLGIGVDSIPPSVQGSAVLTGNDLGMLGNVDRLPSDTDVAAFVATSSEIRALLKTEDVNKIHLRAQRYLEEKDVVSAWKLLLATYK